MMYAFIWFWQHIYNTCQRLNIFLGTNHPTLSRNVMLITGENRRLISRMSRISTAIKTPISNFLEKYNFTVSFTSTCAASLSKCSHTQLSLMRAFSLLRGSQVKVRGVILHFSTVRYVILCYALSVSNTVGCAARRQNEMGHLFYMGGIK